MNHEEAIECIDKDIQVFEDRNERHYLVHVRRYLNLQEDRIKKLEAALEGKDETN